MIALGIDVCLGRCSVAVLSGEGTLASKSEAMARGHVERLAPMVSEVLSEAAIVPTDLDRIGVTCGPGGFTGARLGVSFARGLALSTRARAVGVSTLEAIAAQVDTQRALVALDGRRGDLFVQVFDGGSSMTEPEAILIADLDDFARLNAVETIIGPDPLPVLDPATVARLAMDDEAGSELPRPLYLRAPDAKAAARPVLR
jgi:tRNA threonylcarbamoyladenosine biosynthesis protein TsaB